MKITKTELIMLEACKDGLDRFIAQTSNTEDPVDVISLINGENTTSDLLWLAGKKFKKDVLIRFACDCALINIDKISPYTDTDTFEKIVNSLKDPDNNPIPTIPSDLILSCYDDEEAYDVLSSIIQCKCTQSSGLYYIVVHATMASINVDCSGLLKGMFNETN